MTTILSTWGNGAAPPLPEELPIRALVGWDGLIVNDESVDIVDMVREFAARFRAESCGQCFPCRMGSEEVAAIMERICEGKGRAADLDRLRETASYIRESARCDIGITSPKPILDALDKFAAKFDDAVRAGKPVPKGSYASQVTAPCMSACPDTLDIPSYVENVRMDRWEEGLQVVRRTCCMPGTIGRVCVRVCEFRCRRNGVDDPVSIKWLKRYLSDTEITKGDVPDKPAPAKDKKVAIIGAGPAGLSCGYFLGLKGYKTTTFEMLDQPGGMAAVGIPDYRLPRNVLAGEEARVRAVGGEFRYGVKVGRDITIPDMFEQGYDAVFIGAGSPGSSSMRCEGEDEGYTGFMPGVDFLKRVALGEKRPLDGDTILVIGGGNVAMDCVRTARRLGFSDVSIVYRRTEKEMPADLVEIRESKEEGVKFKTLLAPVRIHAENGRVTGLECQKMELGEPDASGRRRPVAVEGSNFVIRCDAIVPAIGQSTDVGSFAPEGVEVNKWSELIADPVTYQTSMPNVFGGGDCVTGPATLVAALGAGRRAAHSIATYLETGACRPEPADWLDRAVNALSVTGKVDDAPYACKSHREHPPILDPDVRVRSFEEAEGTLSPAQARRESKRCLRCYRIAVASVGEVNG